MAGFEPLQDHRIVAVNTVLGKDVLSLKEFSGEEALGRTYTFTLTLLAESDGIDPAQLLGTDATVRLEIPPPQGSGTGQTRYFHGFFSKFSHVGYDRQGLSVYEALLVPWLWFMSRSTDCRIFQQETVPAIITQLFNEVGSADFELQLQRSYNPRDYCVQYRESDLNFVTRLMEDEGIYYYFRHQNGKHTLMLVDSMSSHQPYEGFEEIIFRGSTSGVQLKPYIHVWRAGHQVKPGVFVHNDFNFEQPKPFTNTRLVTKAVQPKPNKASDYEHYEAPGGYLTVPDGDVYAKLRIQELQAGFATASGETVARGLSTGYIFNLAQYPRQDQNQGYLVTSSKFQIRNAPGASGGADTRALFACQFTVLPTDGVFRLPRITTRPRIRGSQSAMVTGPEGQEIYTDQYGRVKVQFHWDRYGKADQNSSCWIRVSFGWAGKQWGMFHLPRIGHEVLVEFLEGDPDRPMVTGSLYNADSMPPYPLDAQKTKATIKSLSTPGGGGFNEFRLEDLAGAEQIFMHAQKDMDQRVLEESREWVGTNRHLIVGGNQVEQVGGDKHLTISQGEKNEHIGGSHSLRAGQNYEQNVGSKVGVQAMNQIAFQGMTIVFDAATAITMKCGGNHVTITPGGITINGTVVLINSGGTALYGTPGEPSSPATPKVADDAQPGEVSTESADPEQPVVISAQSSQEVDPLQQAPSVLRPSD
jgi:type VI secretion system secreted protein VgrG